MAIDWAQRVAAGNWTQIRTELDTLGCALTGPLLTPDEAASDSSRRGSRS